MFCVFEIFDEVFGYFVFCGQQGEIVEYVVGGGDCFVLMLIGGGKLLCYQIFVLLCCEVGQGVGIVVLLLIVLMQDQVVVLSEVGVCVVYLNLMLLGVEVVVIECVLCEGEIDLLYVVLECLMMGCFFELFECVKIGLFVIDEVYCVL